MIKSLKGKRDLLAETTIEDIFRELAAKKSLQERKHFWFGISGSWKKTNKEVEQAVRETVREILSHNGGIIAGGALNVDFFATDEALQNNPTAEKIRVYLPVTLERYATHYRKRAGEGVITHAQAEALITQLTKLRNANPKALIENPDNTVVNRDMYFKRNTAVMNASDALAAFQVNESEGVEDIVAKALDQGKPVRRLKYTIK